MKRYAKLTASMLAVVVLTTASLPTVNAAIGGSRSPAPAPRMSSPARVSSPKPSTAPKTTPSTPKVDQPKVDAQPQRSSTMSQPTRQPVVNNYQSSNTRSSWRPAIGSIAAGIGLGALANHFLGSDSPRVNPSSDEPNGELMQRGREDSEREVGERELDDSSWWPWVVGLGVVGCGVYVYRRRRARHAEKTVHL